jgi:hypothetical protein
MALNGFCIGVASSLCLVGFWFPEQLYCRDGVIMQSWAAVCLGMLITHTVTEYETHGWRDVRKTWY